MGRNFDATKDELEARNRQIVSAVKNGANAAAIARKHGLSRERVRQLCYQEGVTPAGPSPQNRLSVVEQQEIIEEYTKEYMSTSIIADKRNVTARTVRLILQTNNIELRREMPLKANKIRAIAMLGIGGRSVIEIARENNYDPILLNAIRHRLEATGLKFNLVDGRTKVAKRKAEA